MALHFWLRKDAKQLSSHLNMSFIIHAQDSETQDQQKTGSTSAHALICV